MITRWFLIIGVLLFAVFAAVYAWLGGFRTPEVDVTTTERPVYVAGQYYSGIPNQRFAELFTQANEAYRGGKLRGTLGNIYYNNPEEEGQPVEAFVGLVVADTMQALPANFRYRTFASGQRVLRARVNAHYTLAPGRLHPALLETAKQRKLALRHVYLEQFPEDAPAEMLVVLK